MHTQTLTHIIKIRTYLVYIQVNINIYTQYIPIYVFNNCYELKFKLHYSYYGKKQKTNKQSKWNKVEHILSAEIF